VVLQRGLDAGLGADAYATTFWWVLAATALTAAPALALARLPAPATATLESAPAFIHPSSAPALDHEAPRPAA
jgi:hypothetical protein